MKIAFAGTGYINKVHAQAAQNLGLELVAVVNHKADSMIEFGKRFGMARQYETVEALAGTVQMDKLNSTSALVLTQTDAGGMDLKTVELP